MLLKKHRRFFPPIYRFHMTVLLREVCGLFFYELSNNDRNDDLEYTAIVFSAGSSSILKFFSI